MCLGKEGGAEVAEEKMRNPRLLDAIAGTTEEKNKEKDISELVITMKRTSRKRNGEDSVGKDFYLRLIGQGVVSPKQLSWVFHQPMEIASSRN